MTAQAAHGFESDHPLFVRGRGGGVSISGVPGAWSLYRVAAGPPAVDSPDTPVYRATPKLSPNALIKSSNWDGYTIDFHLTAAGRLVLKQFVYDERVTRVEAIDEVLEGDFHLWMCQYFSRPPLQIPFEGGVLIADPRRWQCLVQSHRLVPFDASAPWMPAWLEERGLY